MDDLFTALDEQTVTAAGRRASTAGSARRWGTEIQIGPTGRTLVPLTIGPAPAR